MIAARLREEARRHGDAPLLLDAEGALSFGDLQQEFEQLAGDLGAYAGGAVGLLGSRPRWLAPRLLALDGLGAGAHLLPGSGVATVDEASRAGLSAILSESGEATAPRRTVARGRGGRSSGRIVAPVECLPQRRGIIRRRPRGARSTMPGRRLRRCAVPV